MASQSTSERTRRILVLAGGAHSDAQLLDWLSEQTDARLVHTLDEAVAELRSSPFDLVVTDALELLPLTWAGQQDLPQTAIERVGQGICIVDRDGRLVWANARFRSYPPVVHDTLLAACTEQCRRLDAARGDGAPRRQQVYAGAEYAFELAVSPLGEVSAGVERVVALAWDVSRTRRTQERIDAIDAAGRELVSLDADALAEMDIGERLRLLEEKVVHYGHELLHFDHFAIRILDQETNRLDVLLSSGMPAEADLVQMLAEAENQGISGYVAATGRAYICPDVSKDPRYLAGLAGARSSLTVPLSLHDRVIGILNVESDQLDAFTEEDRQFAEIFARYVALALHILQLLVVERRATTGQIAADVEAELAGRLNRITAELTRTVQERTLDPGLRAELESVVAEVERTKLALRSLAEPTGGVTGLLPTAVQRDPLLDGKRVLVADDEDIIRETISDVITKLGAVTVMAADGIEAAALLQSQHFDLVLSDIKMPHKNGYEVFSAARQFSPRCPVILITGFGYDPNHSVVRASKEGLAGVLFKPFKVDQMLDTVRNALRAAAAPH